MTSEIDKTNSTMTVAVGIPTYNNEDTIRETLESLTAQTRPPDRILVVDASSDRTQEIVAAVDSESTVPIEYHRQSDRGHGVGGARQDIYDLLEEDILSCLDTQKRVDNDWLATRMAFHRDHPEYDILSGLRSDDVVRRPAKGVKDPSFLRQSNCSIRKSALDRVDGWDPWMPRGEDWDLRIRLWTSGSDSYTNSDLGAEFIERDKPTKQFSKILERPSSAHFLHKYGTWYVRFHPIHVLGDLASLASLFIIGLSLILTMAWSVLALGLLLIPALGAVFYLYHKSFRGSNGLRDIRPSHGIIALRFFVLGYTMLRRALTSGDYDWNYGGFDSTALR